MKSIKVWEVDDVVFYLTCEGFNKGTVVRSHYSADKDKETYSVYCKKDSDSKEYGGHQTSSEKVFKTLKELVDFYSKKV